MFYLDLFSCLAKHHVRYLLVGGLAMNLHGVPRMTMDVDILLIMQEDNLKSFLEVAEELGLRPAVPVNLMDLLKSDVRDRWVREKNMVAFPLAPIDPRGPTIDVLIDPPIEIERALERAEHRSIGAVSIPVASIEDMIQLKICAGRTQDAADIEHLNRIKARSERGAGPVGVS